MFAKLWGMGSNEAGTDGGSLGDSVEEGVEAMLILRGVLDDGGILATLTAVQRHAHDRTGSGVPGRLDEDVPDPGVAGLGDGAQASSLSRGVLAGNETDIGHELAWALEVLHVAELGGKDHGGLGLEPAEATETVDQGVVARREGEVLDAAVPIIPTWSLYSRARVTPQHDLVLVGQGAGGGPACGGSDGGGARSSARPRDRWSPCGA